MCVFIQQRKYHLVPWTVFIICCFCFGFIWFSEVVNNVCNLCFCLFCFLKSAIRHVCYHSLCVWFACCCCFPLFSFLFFSIQAIAKPKWSVNDVFIHPSLPTSLNSKLAFSFERKPPDYKDFHIVCPFAYCAMCPCYVVYRKCCFCLPSSLRFVVVVSLVVFSWVGGGGGREGNLRVWFAFSFILPFFFSFYCLLFGFVFFLLFVCFCVVVLLLFVVAVICRCCFGGSVIFVTWYL